MGERVLPRRWLWWTLFPASTHLTRTRVANVTYSKCRKWMREQQHGTDSALQRVFQITRRIGKSIQGLQFPYLHPHPRPHLHPHLHPLLLPNPRPLNPHWHRHPHRKRSRAGGEMLRGSLYQLGRETVADKKIEKEKQQKVVDQQKEGKEKAQQEKH